MAANVINTLLVAINLDSGALRQDLRQVQTQLEAAVKIMNEFSAGVAAGFKNADKTVRTLGDSVQKAGASLDKVGEESGESLDKVADKAEEAAAELEETESAAQKIGNTIGTFLKSALMGLISPLTDMFSLDGLFKDYCSDLDTLDELTRKTSLSMEERAKKQELLGKYSKDDLENYKESRKALDDYKESLGRAFAPIMKVGLTALTWLARGLEQVLKFVQKHQAFVLPFIIGLAAVLSGVLVPALRATDSASLKAMKSIAKALLPFWPIIALIAAIALVVEDLWVYMHGGKSALSEFWSIFGTGEEITQALSEAWEDLKIIGSAIWGALKVSLSKFFSYFKGAVEPLKNIFKNTLKLIKAIFTGNFAEAIQHLKNLLSSIREYIVAVFSGAFNLVYDIIVSIFSSIGNFFKGIFDSILTTVINTVKEIISNIPDFLLPDSIIQWAHSVDETVKDAAGNMDAAVADPVSNAAVAAVAPTQSTEIDNSVRTDVHSIHVYTQATDGEGVARDIKPALEKRVALTGNRNMGGAGR